ncbi:MAG: riboflavin kinase [Candidatus Paceibacterota bacterium]
MRYRISGTVIKGDGYGRKLGFPTVNLDLGAETEDLPEEGVYSGTVMLDGKEYRAGIVVGPDDKMEAHLMGYNEDAYGKRVIFKIDKFLRKYKKFKNEKELITQIEKDLKMC